MTAELAELVDDLVGIPDDTVVYRRVDWDRVGGISRCLVGGTPSLNGNCFADYPVSKAREYGLADACTSVAVGAALNASGIHTSSLLDQYPGYGLARLRVAELRVLKRGNGTACPQGIMLFPTDDEPWHGVVFDITDRPRKGAVQKAIARIAEWEVPLVRTL